MRLLLVLLLTACINSRKICRIEIKNESGYSFDKIEVDINSHTINTSSLVAGATNKISFSSDSIIVKHDVVFTLRGYVKDSTVFKKSFFSNDLGYVPTDFKIKIMEGYTIQQY